MFTKLLHKSPDGVRHETKYELNRGVYEILRGRCAALMRRDKYTVDEDGYRISSLYFEDIYGSAYSDKTGGFLKRKKFRIRAYNLSPDRITLEGKYKDGEYIKKKSAVLTFDEYKAILKGDYSFCLERQNSEAVKDFCREALTNGLKPAVITDYVRDAYTADAGNVRITFDKKLQAGVNSFDIFEAAYLPINDYYDKVVLEIKYDRFIPSYIQELFSGIPLMAKPVSKYVLCADKLLEGNKK
ncbi:MAG: polyphosphate polymerase domain-containing protein [Oscillospiraceae bacterium]|nr:polyphosphate polymerase domain-containing protein [Oscillospiraceae bacterium]